jgi:hypothetical protein
VKLRASTKIAIGFVAVVGGVFFGYKYITDLMIRDTKFPEIKPGVATLLGIDPGSGYRIIVANDVAALVTGGSQEEGEMSERSTDTRKKLSIKNMLSVLQGDEKPLGKFVMALNEIKEGSADWPTRPVYWDAEDVQKALSGDAQLRAKLESDLNVKLDGTPLGVLSIKAFQNGIIINLPVPVKVLVGGKQVEMVGRVLDPYRPRFCMELENEKLRDKLYTPDTVRGFYIDASTKVANGEKPKEKVADSLKERMAPRRLADLAKAPTNILSKARIILNESFIEGARLEEFTPESGKPVYRLIMNLTDEGRRRLWQYSKLHGGTQLLFVVNGTAIAAPVVKNEIPQAEVTITNLRDGDLAKAAVETLNRHANVKGKKL